MPITFLSHPIHLPDFSMFDREYLGKQESQNEDQKVFHKDTLEVSQLSKNRENLMDKIKHTVVHSVTSFSDMRAGILKEIREEKGQYGYSDVVNACGLSYARLYSEIEQRYENEQYYKVDGTPLTKEDEIEWLDIQFEQEVAWQKSCARITAQGQVIQGNIPEMPTEEMEELEDSFYQAKDAYMKLYRENRRAERPLVLQSYMFGNSQMYQILNREGGIMQVNSSNGSLQQRFFSGTGSIGGIHLPDFNDKYIFSKKKSGVSDKEYRKQIREQAYEDFEKGQFQNKSEGFNRLMKSYTSEVSPDRKGIITSGLKAISRNRQNVLKPIDFVATLLEGKVKYQKLPSGNSDYIEFYDKNGEMVTTYSNNGWTMYTTNAEAARQTEMCMIYNEAWGNAKRGIPMAGEEMVNVVDMQSSFDAKA